MRDLAGMIGLGRGFAKALGEGPEGGALLASAAAAANASGAVVKAETPGRRVSSERRVSNRACRFCPLVLSLRAAVNISWSLALITVCRMDLTAALVCSWGKHLPARAENEKNSAMFARLSVAAPRSSEKDS